MESKAPSAQEVSEYLKTLGWDSEKWTVLKESEWQPLMKVSGYQNNMFDAVKDPAGRKMFDKNARIVERKWMNTHMASVTHAELPDAAPIPPPPPAKVPEKLQEIADASPNVVIASVPPPPPTKEEPKAEPVKQEVEWPGFVKTRALNLIAKGWKMKGDDMVESPEGKILGYEDLETMEDKEWTSYITVAPKEKTIEEKAEEASAARQAKNEEIRKQKEAEKLAEQPLKEAEADIEASKAEQKDFEELEGQEPSGMTVEEAVAKEDATEVETVMSNEKGEIQLTEEQAEIFKHEIDSSMTTGDQGGVFHALAQMGFGQLHLAVKPLANGKFKVIMEMTCKELSLADCRQLMNDSVKIKN